MPLLSIYSSFCSLYRPVLFNGTNTSVRGLIRKYISFHGTSVHRWAHIEDTLFQHHWCSDHMLSHFIHSSSQNLVGTGWWPKSGNRRSGPSLCSSQWSIGVCSIPGEPVPTRHSLYGEACLYHTFFSNLINDWFRFYHTQTYHCMASNSFGSIRSRDCQVRAGEYYIFISRTLDRCFLTQMVIVGVWCYLK